MDRKRLFSVDELLEMNEKLLGRGMPVQNDGIGYNKADYGACSTYYKGLSDAQIADLSKRLVKYSVTQLNVNREDMRHTAKHYLRSVNGDTNERLGISIDIGDSETIIGFRYEPIFISVIKKRPIRRFDAGKKQWIIPNGDVINTLKSLKDMGADTRNAIQYATDNIKDTHFEAKIKDEKDVDIEVRHRGNEVLVKFEYSKNVIDTIKDVDKSHRRWNPESKHWAINKSHFHALEKALSSIAKFTYIKD